MQRTKRHEVGLEDDPEPKDPNQGGEPEGGAPAGGEGELTAEQIAQLKRENDELKQKNQTLANEKQTVEQRLQEVTTTKPGAPAEAERAEPVEPDFEKQIAEAVVEAQIDPENAGKKLASLFTKATTDAHRKAVDTATKQVHGDIEWQKHTEKVREKNHDLVKYEKRIARDAGELLQSGRAKTPHEALDTAIKNFREEFNMPEPKQPKSQPETPAGKGAGAEKGGSDFTPSEGRDPKKGTKKDEDDTESDADYVAREKERRARLGV